MIEQNVRVVRSQGERMWVQMGSQSGCSACDNGKGCGAGVFSKLLRRKPVVIELSRNNMEIEAGQMLTLAFPERVFIRLVLASYGWPLLAGLVGAVSGHSLCVWLQFGAMMVDIGTLAGALIAGAVALRLIRNRTNFELIFNTLKTTLYYPSVAPNMCSMGSQASGRGPEPGSDQF